MSPSYVYLALDSGGNLLLGVTKHVELELFTSSEEEQLIRVVFLEKFDSMVAALVRQAAIRKMNVARRWLLVRKYNPDCRDLSSQAEDSLLGLTESPAVAARQGVTPGDLVSLWFADDRPEDPPGSAPVTARLPIGPDDPVRTRSGAIAVVPYHDHS